MINLHDDPLSEEIYELAIKPNRTAQDDIRRKQLEDLRTGLRVKAQTQVQTEAEEKKIEKRLEAFGLSQQSTNRYTDYTPKKMYHRYNSQAAQI